MRPTLTDREFALLNEIRELEESGFMGSLQLHFPGNGGAWKPVLVPAKKLIELEKEIFIDSHMT